MAEINFEAFDDYEEREVRPGGGGGGGKKEHQGKKTQVAKGLEFKTQAEKKRELEEERHPEESEEENTHFEATIRRLLELDSKEVGLPRLEGYFLWVRKLLEDDEFRATRSIGTECRLELFKRSKGAGGQNVNKVETAVRLEHLPTGISLERYQNRSQEVNRKDALKAAKDLIEKHIDEVLDMVTESDLPTTEVLRRALNSVAGDPREQEWWSEAKKSSLERIKSVILRNKG